jgi:predicted MarR family transcription regulator
MTDNSEAKTKLVMRNGKLVTVSIITRDEADKLNDFAQGLDDEITHVVDYGGVEEDTKKKKPKRKK